MSEYYIYNGELYHHGIKGQRWGVRRFQNRDGSLTNAGRRRYQDSPELQKQRSDMQKAKKARSKSLGEYNDTSNTYSYIPTEANKVKMDEARYKFRLDDIAYQQSKLKYKSNREAARIREKNIEFKNKSKHRLKLEEQYKQMGLNEEQAQAAANNRIRTEKILAASATVAVSACAAYVVNKKMKDRIDGVIKAGESLQRIEMQDTGGKLHDVFYVAKGKHDEKRYENLLGLARKNATGHAYMMKLEASSDIKVASKDKAAKAFGDLYKNDAEFRKSVKDHVEIHFAGGNPIRDVDNVSDRNIKKMYENFNANIIHIRESGSGADKKFYDKLKSAGYGAIQDINDMKYSGYNAKNPLIIFDNKNSNIMVKSVREMTENLEAKGTRELLKATGESVAKDFMIKAGPLSAAALTAKTVSTYKSNPNMHSKFVEQYIKEHPNTTLTNAQIAKLYEKNKK